MRGNIGLPALFIAGLALGQLAVRDPIKVNRSYTCEFAKIDLIGVCKVSETDVSCWNAEGKPDLKIRDMALTDFSRALMSLNLQYKRKTRVAFFRVVPTLRPNSTLGYAGVSWINSSSDFGRNEYGAYYDSSKPHVKGMVISGSPAQKTGSVFIKIDRHEPASDLLPVKVGARIEYLGAEIKITRILRSTLDPPPDDGERGPRWYIEIEAKVRPFEWAAMDKDGIRVGAVDGEGKPVYLDPSTPLRDRQYMTQNNKSPYSLARVTPLWQNSPFSGPQSTSAGLFTNIDPDRMTSLVAQGSSATQVEITGIPLDPK